MTALFIACTPDPSAGDPSAEVGHFTGAVGELMLAAVLHEDGSVEAYACGGATNFATHTRWFIGEPDLLEKDGATLKLANVQGELDATLSMPDGEVFEATLAPSSDLEGLWSADEGGCRAGAILSSTDGDFALQGVYCDMDGMSYQVVPVGSIVTTPDDGLEVQALGLDSDAFEVHRIRP
jgi:hypothetical protein